MPETPSLDPGSWLDSLFLLSGIFVHCRDGALRFDGERPGAQWHAHGWFEKWLTVLVHGEVQKRKLLKRRWRWVGTNTTCHSRPPNDLVLVRFCSLLVVVRLWAWLSSPKGFHRRTELLPSLGQDCGSDRTVQRWMARALDNALRVQQAIRHAILALRIVEPRPEDDPLKRGRAPPKGLLSRGWHDAQSVSTLWRALDLLFDFANRQSLGVALLLAETHGRWLSEQDIFPI